MNILEYENYYENKTHVDLSFPYNTYLCSIPLDFTEVPLHWHEEMELIYIKKGKACVTVDFREYIVSSNTIVLILPGQLHSIGQLDDCSVEYENILFHPGMLLPKRTDSSAEFITSLLSGIVTVPTVFTPVYPYYPEISSCIDACDEICKTKPQGYLLYIKSQLYRLFFLLDNRCRNLIRTPKNKKTLDKMKQILKYVEEHYMERITIADIAGIAGFSESHFMRYFKETMGTSFIEYLKEYRLTMASRLLTTSESTILDIADEVGFENLSYFNRAFKIKYGMTPSQFRKQK